MIDGVVFIAVTVEDRREGTAVVVGLPMNGEGALLIVEEGGVVGGGGVGLLFARGLMVREGVLLIEVE